ncbi:MAG: MFS transporter [Anaerolineales bacterium]
MTNASTVSRKRALHLARAYYFFYFGAIGCFLPYVGLHFASIGLSGTQIGLLISVLPLGVIVAGPLLGALADQFHLHRVLLPLASFAPIPAVLLMAGTTQFEWLLLLMMAVACFATPISALIDSATLELLDGDTQAYGGIRLGGTFGFVTLTLAMGAAIDAFGPMSVFVGYALSLGVAGLIALGLPAHPPEGEGGTVVPAPKLDEVQRRASEPRNISCDLFHSRSPLRGALPAHRRELRAGYGAGLRALLSQRSMIFFLGGSLLIGAAVQAFFSFFSLHLQTLGATAGLIGLANALTSISEVPVLLFSRRFLARLGAWGSVMLGAATYGIRWLLLALVIDPVAATVIQILHGASFGLYLIGGVAFVDERTPAGLRATAQAMFSAALNGLGAALGSAAGGLVYERAGGSTMFLWAAVTSALGLLLVSTTRSTSTNPPPTSADA